VGSAPLRETEGGRGAETVVFIEMAETSDGVRGGPLGVCGVEGAELVGSDVLTVLSLSAVGSLLLEGGVLEDGGFALRSVAFSIAVSRLMAVLSGKAVSFRLIVLFLSEVG
jgi:hypothetical protein